MAAGDYNSQHGSGRGSQRRRTPAPLPAPVCKTVSQLASQFRQQHGLQDRSAADRIARMLKASITPQAAEGQTRQSRSPTCGGDATAGD